MAESTDNEIDEQPKKKSKYDKFWRTPKLAEPRHARPKYEYDPIYEYKSTVRPTALTIECSSRISDMAQPKIRQLQEVKKNNKFLGPFYEKVMDKKISDSWATIYHYYDRLIAELNKKKPKKKKEKGTTLSLKDYRSGIPTKQKLELFKQWSEKNAMPKKGFPPEPIDRGKRVELDNIKGHISEMATPSQLPTGYLAPREIPIPVPWNALHGEIRGASLALYYGRKEKPKVVEKPPGYINPAALKYIATDRIKEIATPKTKREKRDVDIKENPFSISPAALKYKATDRILQLAKPLERD